LERDAGGDLFRDISDKPFVTKIIASTSRRVASQPFFPIQTVV
jgi:hypothetical protein